MKKLYIDSSQRNFKKVQIIEHVEGHDNVLDEINGDIDIADSIQQLLLRNKLKFQGLGKTEVFLGPGSFTGLKIGVTFANVLNWAQGKIKATEFAVPDYGSEPNVQRK